MPDPLPPIGFLVVGAQKGATSWLFYCLRDHPQLCLPDKKRESDYIGGPTYRERGEAWYFGLFARWRPGQLAGAVSVDYMFDAAAADEVWRVAPNAKLIAMVREPVDRAVSAYYWLVRKRLIPKIGILPALEQGLRDSRSGTQSPFAELLTRGLYARQLGQYLQRFPAEHVLVGAYDDVVADAAAAISGIYRFLEVDPTFAPPSRSTRPKANAFSDILVSLERLAPTSRILAHTSGFLHNAMRRLGVGGTRPQLPARLNTELREFFSDDLRALGRQLSRTHVVSHETRETVRGWHD